MEMLQLWKDKCNNNNNNNTNSTESLSTEDNKTTLLEILNKLRSVVVTRTRNRRTVIFYMRTGKIQNNEHFNDF